MNEELTSEITEELRPRKSSILKLPKPRIPLQNLRSNEEDPRQKKVSFAGVNKIKEFNTKAESMLLCNTPAYEEEFSSSSESSQSYIRSGSCSSMSLTGPPSPLFVVSSPVNMCSDYSENIPPKDMNQILMIDQPKIPPPVSYYFRKEIFLQECQNDENLDKSLMELTAIPSKENNLNMFQSSGDSVLFPVENKIKSTVNPNTNNQCLSSLKDFDSTVRLNASIELTESIPNWPVFKTTNEEIIESFNDSEVRKAKRNRSSILNTSMELTKPLPRHSALEGILSDSLMELTIQSSPAHKKTRLSVESEVNPCPDQSFFSQVIFGKRDENNTCAGEIVSVASNHPEEYLVNIDGEKEKVSSFIERSTCENYETQLSDKMEETMTIAGVIDELRSSEDRETVNDILECIGQEEKCPTPPELSKLNFSKDATIKEATIVSDSLICTSKQFEKSELCEIENRSALNNNSVEDEGNENSFCSNLDITCVDNKEEEIKKLDSFKFNPLNEMTSENMSLVTETGPIHDIQPPLPTSLPVSMSLINCDSSCTDKTNFKMDMSIISTGATSMSDCLRLALIPPLNSEESFNNKMDSSIHNVIAVEVSHDDSVRKSVCPDEKQLKEVFLDKSVRKSVCPDKNQLSKVFFDESVKKSVFQDEKKLNEVFHNELVRKSVCPDEKKLNEVLHDESVMKSVCPDEKRENEVFHDKSVRKSVFPDEKQLNEVFQNKSVRKSICPDENQLNEVFHKSVRKSVCLDEKLLNGSLMDNNYVEGNSVIENSLNDIKNLESKMEETEPCEFLPKTLEESLNVSPLKEMFIINRKISSKKVSLNVLSDSIPAFPYDVSTTETEINFSKKVFCESNTKKVPEEEKCPQKNTKQNFTSELTLPTINSMHFENSLSVSLPTGVAPVEIDISESICKQVPSSSSKFEHDLENNVPEEEKCPRKNTKQNFTSELMLPTINNMHFENSLSVSLPTGVAPVEMDISESICKQDPLSSSKFEHDLENNDVPSIVNTSMATIESANKNTCKSSSVEALNQNQCVETMEESVDIVETLPDNLNSSISLENEADLSSPIESSVTSSETKNDSDIDSATLAKKEVTSRAVNFDTDTLKNSNEVYTGCAIPNSTNPRFRQIYMDSTGIHVDYGSIFSGEKSYCIPINCKQSLLPSVETKKSVEYHIRDFMEDLYFNYVTWTRWVRRYFKNCLELLIEVPLEIVDRYTSIKDSSIQLNFNIKDPVLSILAPQLLKKLNKHSILRKLKILQDIDNVNSLIQKEVTKVNEIYEDIKNFMKKCPVQINSNNEFYFSIVKFEKITDPNKKTIFEHNPLYFDVFIKINNYNKFSSDDIRIVNVVGKVCENQVKRIFGNIPTGNRRLIDYYWALQDLCTNIEKLKL